MYTVRIEYVHARTKRHSYESIKTYFMIEVRTHIRVAALHGVPVIPMSAPKKMIDSPK